MTAWNIEKGTIVQLPHRIAAQVVVTPECWYWFGRTRDGVEPLLDGEPVDALLWRAYHGPIPPRWRVARACGCALCVRPDHLVLVTELCGLLTLWEGARAS